VTEGADLAVLTVQALARVRAFAQALQAQGQATSEIVREIRDSIGRHCASDTRIAPAQDDERRDRALALKNEAPPRDWHRRGQGHERRRDMAEDHGSTPAKEPESAQ
jgi:hypothetical protein